VIKYLNYPHILILLLIDLLSPNWKINITDEYIKTKKPFQGAGLLK
jgi:hypothetical protein